jgi:hypothetical protein
MERRERKTHRSHRTLNPNPNPNQNALINPRKRAERRRETRNKEKDGTTQMQFNLLFVTESRKRESQAFAPTTTKRSREISQTNR